MQLQNTLGNTNLEGTYAFRNTFRNRRNGILLFACLLTTNVISSNRLINLVCEEMVVVERDKCQRHKA